MATSDFVYDDGGRKDAGYKGTTGDCVTRAVAIASGRPYQEIYDALSEGARSQRKTKRSKIFASARNGVNVRRKWFRDYMTSLGFVWIPTMKIGSGCKVHLNPAELPAKGRLVVAVSRHYTTLIDGVIRDIYDPRRTSIEIVNGVERQYERCVYGYYVLR